MAKADSASQYDQDLATLREAAAEARQAAGHLAAAVQAASAAISGTASNDDPAAGPFDSERQALDLPEVKAAYASITGAGTGTLECVRIMETALSAAGVELGAYDRRVVNWLGNWEAQTCAVIAGLIYRAHAAGRDGAR